MPRKQINATAIIDIVIVVFPEITDAESTFAFEMIGCDTVGVIVGFDGCLVDGSAVGRILLDGDEWTGKDGLTVDRTAIFGLRVGF